MPQTIADRVRINIYETTKFNRARCRCLVGSVACVIATRPAKLNDNASQFQGKTNVMSKYR